MFIYVTSFDPRNKQVTNLSINSGFKSLLEVTDTLGDKYIEITKRMVIYEGVVFSNFPFQSESVTRCFICNGPPCANPGWKGCLNE